MTTSARLVVGRWLTERRSVLFALALIGVTVAVRLPLMPFPGYYHDLATYVGWGERALAHPGTLYTATGNGTRFGGDQGVNYPPGMPYLFALLVTLFGWLVSPGLHLTLGQAVETAGIGPFFAKVPILLADVGVVVLLYEVARRRHSQRFAVLIALSYALSPAVLYDGAAWGQTDGLVALPLVAALVAILAERYAVGGVCLALAVLLKPQPIIFVPLVLLYLWRWRSPGQFWRFAGAGLATLLIGALPVLVPQVQVAAMLHNMSMTSAGASVGLTSDAFNFWWAAGYASQTMSATIFGLPAGLVGDLLFAGVTVLVGVQIWQRREPAVLGMGLAIQMFGCFLFLGGQHERYLFLFIPLMALSLILVPRLDMRPNVVLYLTGTALCTLNMLLGVGGGTFANAQMLPFISLPALSSAVAGSFATLGLLLAIVHCGVFGYAVYIFQRRQRAESSPRENESPGAPVKKLYRAELAFTKRP